MIDYLEIKGYKSIKNLELELKPINILIGSNGVGKSNFVSFFKLINAIFNQRLQRYIIEEGTDNILYFGRKTTQMMTAKMIFSDNGGIHNNSYRFGLSQTKEGGLFINYEGSGCNIIKGDDTHNYLYNYNLSESKYARDTDERNKILQRYISSLQVFHFHDTSSTSFLRRECDINDNQYLKHDGRNLPAILYLLKVKHPVIFNRIEESIQSVAPYIKKFILELSQFAKDQISLRWVDKGATDSNFSAYQLSDGTLRFIALASLLMQPNPPEIIVIDEPELGLHPFAIGELASMIQMASSKSQIIIATQSPGLISEFKPEDIVVVDRSAQENQTIFSRLNSEDLNIWLEESALGDLWERNIINSGQPFIKI